MHSRKEVFKILAIGKARISAYSFRTQLGRLSGPPAREVLTALTFLATAASVRDKGASSYEVTRIFSDRGEYPCITLTNASFIFSLKTLSSNTKFGWRMVLISSPPSDQRTEYLSKDIRSCRKFKRKNCENVTPRLGLKIP